MVKIAEATGSKVDNVVKLEILKREDEAIQLEKKLILEEMAKSEARAVKEEIVTVPEDYLRRVVCHGLFEVQQLRRQKCV